MDNPQPGIFMKIQKSPSDSVYNVEALWPIKQQIPCLICPILSRNYVDYYYYEGVNYPRESVRCSPNKTMSRLL